jgi:hypothetical protein
MRIVTPKEAEAVSIEQLGLDPNVLDLTSPEALAELIRRIGAFLCPCPPSKLILAGVSLVEPLNCLQSPRESISDTVDALTAYGDLIESNDISGESSSRMIYLAPPSFVEVSSTVYLLIGAGPDGCYPLPKELRALAEPVAHYRRLRVSDASAVRDALSQAGFLEVSTDTWLKAPCQTAPGSLRQLYDDLLQQSGVPGTVDELRILETERPVTYYLGRWAASSGQSGRFLGRRPQAYGADLWCYVELKQGVVTRLLNLPSREIRWRACDEAWHLQQAIDAAEGRPQTYRCRNGHTAGTTAVDFFSPVPQWASRRWDYTGTPVVTTRCLFSYVFDNDQLGDELAFMQERMWLQKQ